MYSSHKRGLHEIVRRPPRRAGRACQQKIHVMPRNLPRHLENINHGWTAAHDSVEFEIANQALLEIMNSSSSIELLGKISKGLLQALAVEWLRKIIVRAMLNGLDGGINGVEPRHENHINARIPVQRLLQKRPPAHTGHLQIT